MDNHNTQPRLRSLSQLEYSREETPIWDCLLIIGFTSQVEVCWGKSLFSWDVLKILEGEL